jgi:pyruvate/2-oxoglutarate dehydrogenase complex dihydrolipoamide dehydrogenase (E3) component
MRKKYKIERLEVVENFDAIILGMGPGGEVVSGRLLAAGKKVAVVERELLGGECAYWACIPSKTLIRPPEVRNEAMRTQGTGTPTLDLKDIFDYRDYIIRNLDDSGEIESYEEKGATVVKGEGHLNGPGRVEVNGEILEADHVVVATGSASNTLPIEGLENVPVWTNRETTTTHEVPERALVIGGGPNGIETSQWLSRRERVLVGAWAVAPLAGEWIHQACLAVRTRMRVDTLLDSVAQFPTFSQAYLAALETMDL